MRCERRGRTRSPRRRPVNGTIRDLPPFEPKSTKRAVTPGAFAQSLGPIDPFSRGSDDGTGEMVAKIVRGGAGGVRSWSLPQARGPGRGGRPAVVAFA